MLPCPRCGQPTDLNASFCPRCGAALIASSGVPAGPTPRPRDTRTAENLILAGAILGAILLLAPGALLLVAGLAFSGMAEGAATGTFFDVFLLPLLFFGAIGPVFVVFGVILVVLGGAWTWGTLRARRQIREGNVESGSILAIILGGALVLLGFGPMIPLVPGGLVLAGGLVARSAR